MGAACWLALKMKKPRLATGGKAMLLDRLCVQQRQDATN